LDGGDRKTYNDLSYDSGLSEGSEEECKKSSKSNDQTYLED